MLSILVLIGALGQGVLDDPDTPPIESAPGIIATLEVKGAPGRPEKEISLQRLAALPDRLQVIDGERGVITILRLDRDPKVLWELSLDGSRYREGKDLDAVQRDRDRQERQLVSRSKNLPDRERNRILTANHLRSDGKRVVEVEEITGEEQERLGRPVKQFLVHENGRLVIDLLIADIDTDIPFFQFYREVGAFSREVLTAIEKLEGMPLEATFTVVTATLSHPLNVRVIDLEEGKLRIEAFDLPANAERIEESPIAHCPICGNQVEKSAPGGKTRLRDGSWLYFDSRQCVREWRKQQYGKDASGD